MMRKKNLIIILFILLGFIAYNIIKSSATYSKNIYSNWQIKLPNSYAQIYPNNDDNNLQKISKRYHIFQYKDINNINEAVQWKIKDNSSLEDDIIKFLDNMNIPKEYMPKFQCDYKYFSTQKDDSSVIYIVFIEDLKLIYVIEDIKS